MALEILSHMIALTTIEFEGVVNPFGQLGIVEQQVLHLGHRYVGQVHPSAMAASLAMSTFLPFFSVAASFLPAINSAICSRITSAMMDSSSSRLRSRTAISSIFDCLGALVLVGAAPGKTLASMTIPWTPGGTRREVSLTSPAFSPKDGPQQLFFGRQLRFPLGGDFAHQDIALGRPRPPGG
jgi:hypothetical protein